MAELFQVGRDESLLILKDISEKLQICAAKMNNPECSLLNENLVLTDYYTMYEKDDPNYNDSKEEFDSICGTHKLSIVNLEQSDVCNNKKLDWNECFQRTSQLRIYSISILEQEMEVFMKTYIYEFFECDISYWKFIYSEEQRLWIAEPDEKDDFAIILDFSSYSL